MGTVHTETPAPGPSGLARGAPRGRLGWPAGRTGRPQTLLEPGAWCSPPVTVTSGGPRASGVGRTGGGRVGCSDACVECGRGSLY